MGLERKDGGVRKFLRAAIGIVVLFEALAFLVGAALHLGVDLPVPYVERLSYSCALLETASAGAFLVVAAAVAVRPRHAWKLAVVAHVIGVASIAWGITKGSAPLAQTSHHPAMLILLIVVVIALSLPFSRDALENGHRSKRRRRVLQSL